ncbi:MAG: cell division protein Fic [Gammaproteobacteria bacterium]|nr:cell division protein Fic [Gammaproteobacteria bacterium]
MPKIVSESDLQRLQDVILRYPAGVGIAKLAEEFHGSISRRTLGRRLQTLLQAGRIQRRGELKGAIYFPATVARTPIRQPVSTAGQFETPDGPVTIPLSPAAREILEYVSRPAAARNPQGYERRLLDDYEPNRTTYLPAQIKVRLHKLGKPIVAERAAGTFARDILSRLLIDLSWASSRLEGNTYSRLDTQRLIEFGHAAEGKDAKETQMILNHKVAIEMLVEGSDDIGINRFTLLNLHAALSENLMADPEASGRLRRRPVEIGKSVYTPPAVPQVIEEHLDLIIQKAAVIADPFERAFFLMVHVPYLQPFEDVNKRVSRLAANIPLIKNDLCPLSFVDVPEAAYISGNLGVYELTRVELLLDVFAWAYERSCYRYVVVRDSVAEPDVFRMKYRNVLADVVGGIVRDRKQPTEDEIRARATSVVEARDLTKFIELTSREFGRLNDGNITRFRIRPSEYWDWFNAVKAPHITR